jgi:hypothetical protein
VIGNIITLMEMDFISYQMAQYMKANSLKELNQVKANIHLVMVQSISVIFSTTHLTGKVFSLISMVENIPDNGKMV